MVLKILIKISLKIYIENPITLLGRFIEFGRMAKEKKRIKDCGPRKLFFLNIDDAICTTDNIDHIHSPCA